MSSREAFQPQWFWDSVKYYPELPNSSGIYSLHAILGYLQTESVKSVSPPSWVWPGSEVNAVVSAGVWSPSMTWVSPECAAWFLGIQPSLPWLCHLFVYITLWDPLCWASQCQLNKNHWVFLKISTDCYHIAQQHCVHSHLLHDMPKNLNYWKTTIY